MTDGDIVVKQSWFRPLPVQQAFIESGEAEVFYAGGVGSGKTLSGAFKAFVISDLFPGTVGLVGRQTYRALEDTTKRVLLDGDDKPAVIPPAVIAKRSETDQSITLHNGSRILFRSFQDANLEKLLSLNLGWFWLDEAAECTEKIWSTLLGRLRHPVGPGIAYGTTNPNGHDWIWRRAHPDAGQGLAELHIAPTESNPHLPADYVRRLRAMPREWQKRWVDCSFDTAAGQIWDTWSSAVHVYAADLVRVPPEWRRIESLDHGTRNPTSVLWAQVDRDGNVWVTDEYYDPGIVSQHATAIMAMHPETGVVKADPSVFSQGPDGVSVADLYTRAGVRLRRAVNDVSAGLLRVSEYLEPVEEKSFPHEHPRRGEVGAPSVFVSDRCRNLIREIPDYRWRDLSPSAERDRDNPEEPRKKDDHACFPAGTLVTTERGEVPIEQVEVGDLALTRRGWRSVTAAAMTSESEPLLRVALDCGGTLTATADHPVWADGEWRPMDTLRYPMVCVIDASSSRASGITGMARRRTCGAAESSFIARCGSRLTVRSLRDITSTTRTEILGTTRSLTSDSAALRSIAPSTRRWAAIRRRLFWRTSSAFARSPWNGTAALRGANGIDSTASSYSGIAPKWASSASSAGLPTRAPTGRGPSSVPTTASRRGVELSDSISLSDRASAARRRLSAIGTTRRGSALARVLRPPAPVGRAPVYNLTVEGEHEFFADGVLVSNCDALRYLLADLPRPSREVDTAALLEREKRAPERRSHSAGVLTTRF